MFPTDSEALGCGTPVDGALDLKQGVELLHGFERDRVDQACVLAAALLAGCAFDVGELEELAPRVSEAACFEHRAGQPAGCVKLVVAGIGVSLQEPRPGGEMRAWMLGAPVAGIVEQRRRRCRTGERPVIAHIDP